MCIRPGLWTITNTFIIIYLAIGMLYGCIRFILTIFTIHIVGVNEDPNLFVPYDDLLDQFPLSFQICLANAINGLIYGYVTAYILVGLIFMSSVLVKYGGCLLYTSPSPRD